MAAWVADHPGHTADEISRAVRARTAEVRHVLTSGPFIGSLRQSWASDKATVYRIGIREGDGTGRPGRRSQCDRIAAVLADGRPHSMEEIHRIVGTCRLNSRIAELRKRRGMNIVCDKSGGHYIYRLVEAVSETPAVMPADPAAGVSPTAFEQESLLDGREAA